MSPVRPAVLLAVLLAGCGVKAPPRPPARADAPDRGASAPAPAPPGAATCETCGAREAAPPPRTP